MTTTKKLSFEDYPDLADPGYEGIVELVDGELVELPPESGMNLAIAAYFYMELVRVGVPFLHIHMGRCKIQTPIMERGDAAN